MTSLNCSHGLFTESPGKSINDVFGTSYCAEEFDQFIKSVKVAKVPGIGFKAVNRDRAVALCVLAREMSVLADKQGGMGTNARDCFPRTANPVDDSRLWNV